MSPFLQPLLSVLFLGLVMDGFLALSMVLIIVPKDFLCGLSKKRWEKLKRVILIVEASNLRPFGRIGIIIMN